MSFTANNRGGRRPGGGGAGRGQRGGNSQRVLCDMCHHYHRTDEDCRPPCARCNRRHNPNSACPQQVQQAPAAQPRPTVDLGVTQRVVGQHGDMITQLQDDMRQMQALNEQLQDTVRHQGDQINILRQEVAGLRRVAAPGLAQDSGPAIATAAAGMADAGALVGRKRGREEDEFVGGSSKKKSRHRGGLKKKAAMDANAPGGSGDIHMDVDPPVTFPQGVAPGAPAFPPQNAPVAQAQPLPVQFTDDGFVTIDGFVFNEQWLVQNTVPNTAVSPDEDARATSEMARSIMAYGVHLWRRLIDAARASGLDLVSQAQIWRATEAAVQAEAAAKPLPEGEDDDSI